MKVIAILDFTSGEVHIHIYVNEKGLDAEEIVEELGYNSSQCHYMVTDSSKIKIH